MRRRILASTLMITATAVLMFAIPLAVVVGRLLDEQGALRLERQAVLAARNIPADFATGDDPTELPTDDGIDYALYAVDGRLIAGIGPATVDALTRQALDNRVVDGEIGETLVVAIPVVDDEQVIGVVRAAQSTAPIDQRRTRALTLIVGLGTGIVAIAAGAAWVFAGRLARPIRQIRDATVQLGTGDFSIAAPTSRIPELADTAESLAATARRLDELVARERAFSADASHQLRTPLTAMRTTLETELAFPQPDPTVAIGEVLGDIDRLEATITELLQLARTSDRPAEIELGPVLTELDATWTPRIAAHGRRLHVEPGRYTPPVFGHPTMLRHALDVLVDNAVVHGRGDITVTVTVDDHTVTITVNDHGPGVANDGRDHHHRDTTGDPSSWVPTGHGLPLAQRLVAAQHGRLDLLPPPGGHVAIRLRRVEPTAAP